VAGTGRRLDPGLGPARGLPPSRVPALPASGGRPAPETGGRDPLETEARLAAEQELAGAGRGPAFDLSAVRIHADAEAGALNRAMQSAAVTVGGDVYFGAGRFQPETGPGRALIAHELTHVEQQRRDGRLRLQLSPDPPAHEQQSAGSAAPGTAAPSSAGAGSATAGSSSASGLQLPWSDKDSSLFEATASDITFLVAIPPAKEKQIRAVIPEIGARIAQDNQRIRSPARRVMTCFIADAGSEFVRWRKAPAILLNDSEVTPEAAAHEMGHATFDAFADPAASGGPSTAEAADDQEIRLRLADLYDRLNATRKPAGSAIPVGLLMVDPSEWASGKGVGGEHPWVNVGEFFASAKAAYQIDPKALQSSIDKAARTDPTARQLGQELTDLLDAVYGKGRLPQQALPAGRKKAAEAAPYGPKWDKDVEELTVLHHQVDLLLHPTQRRGQPAPKAGTPPSAPATKPSEAPATKPSSAPTTTPAGAPATKPSGGSATKQP
jgi:Domain of unknown function (DUF4157)